MRPAWFGLTSTLLAIGLALSWAAPVHAQGIIGAIAGGILKGALGVIQLILDIAVGIIASILAVINWLLIKLIEWAASETILRELFSYGGGIHTVWEAVLNIANVFFFLALIIFSILIITRQAGYNFKQSITKLVVVVFLANMSFIVARILIFDFGFPLAELARTAIEGANPSDFGNVVGQSVWGSMHMGIEWFSGATPARWIQSIMVLVFQVVFTFSLILVGFVLIERTVRLVILTIFAPIQFAFSLLPNKDLQNLSSSWWSDMIKWVLVLPFVWFLMSAAMKILQSAYAGEEAFINTFTTILSENAAQVPARDWTGVMVTIVAISLIAAAGSVPKLLGISLSAVTQMIGGAPAALAGKYAKQFAGKEIGYAAETVGMKAGLGRLISAAKARGSRMEAQRNVWEQANQSRVDEGIRKRHLKITTEVDRIKNDITAKKFGGKKFDDLEDVDKEEVNKIFKKEKFLLAEKAKVSEKEFIEYSVRQRKLQQDIARGHESAERELGKLVEKFESDIATETDKSDLLGQWDWILSQANRGGPASVPWRILANKILTDPSAMDAVKKTAYLWTPKQRYEVSERDRDLYKARMQKEVKDEDYIKKAELDSQSQKLKGDLRSQLTDEDLRIIVEIAGKLSEEQLKLLKDMPEEDLNKLGNVPLGSIRQLDEQDKQAIRGVQESGRPDSEKADTIEKLLKDSGSFTDPLSGTVNDTNAKNTADLLTRTNISPDTIANVQGITPAMKDSLDSVIEYKKNASERASLESKLSASNPPTPGVELAIEERKKNGELTSSDIRSFNQVHLNLSQSFATKIEQDKSIGPKTSVGDIADETALKNIVDIMQKTGVATQIKLGKTINNTEDLRKLNYQEVDSIIRKINAAWDKLTKPPKNYNIEAEEGE